MSGRLLAVTCLLFVSIALPQQNRQSGSPQPILLSGDVKFTHDPSIIKDGDTWYLFATANGAVNKGELPIRCSRNLQRWKLCGYVFDQLPQWIKKDSPKTKQLWAPDISYFNGEFHLYYAFSVFGRNTSGIALATNKTLDSSRADFRWADRGLVLRSDEADDFNAIDPSLTIDGQGRAWLSFGSFWGGIKMRRIDPRTGKLSSEDTKLYSIAARERPANPPPNPAGLPGNWQAIEAPCVVHQGDYYYLFVSFDLCCRGTKSNYKTMIGRSREVTGPYEDATGKPMMKGGGTALLVGNDRWLGPGGESVLRENGHDIIVFHAYDAKTGDAYLRISNLSWQGGWPHAALGEDTPASNDR